MDKDLLSGFVGFSENASGGENVVNMVLRPDFEFIALYGVWCPPLVAFDPSNGK